jgi:hypothetical protein
VLSKVLQPSNVDAVISEKLPWRLGERRMKDSQAKRIWAFLEVHPEGLTTLEAAYFLHITKLPTRIGEMIRDGYPISITPETHVNEWGVTERYNRYRKAA